MEISNALRSRRVAAQQKRVAKQILDDLGFVEREALTRFYAAGQSADQICRDLVITPEEFYRIKSRARNQFHQRSNAHLHEGRDLGSERNDGFDELEA